MRTIEPRAITQQWAGIRASGKHDDGDAARCTRQMAEAGSEHFVGERDPG